MPLSKYLYLLIVIQHTLYIETKQTGFGKERLSKLMIKKRASTLHGTDLRGEI